MQGQGCTRGLKMRGVRQSRQSRSAPASSPSLIVQDSDDSNDSDREPGAVLRRMQEPSIDTATAGSKVPQDSDDSNNSDREDHTSDSTTNVTLVVQDTTGSATLIQQVSRLGTGRNG